MQKQKVKRILPLDISKMNDSQRSLLDVPNSKPNNLFSTVIKHPEAFKTWRSLAQFVNQSSSLPARDRELMIHRICWIQQAEWEWGKHRQRAFDAGLTIEEIERTKEEPSKDKWEDWELALMNAVDGLAKNAMIPDESWKILSTRYNEQQMIELILHTGHYQIANMMTKSLGVPNEKNMPGFTCHDDKVK